MRLFFALWPDARARAELVAAASALRLDGGARRVPPENFHVTLAFVGEVSESALAALLEIGRDQRAAGCTLNLGVLEYWAQSRVVVALASETPPSMIGLSVQLYRHLARRSAADIDGGSLTPAAVPLRAHVTLARKVAQAPVQQAMCPIAWSARSFSLVCSNTTGAQSAYTVVDTWPLLDERAET